MSEIKNLILELQTLKNENFSLNVLIRKLKEENISLKKKIDELLLVDDSLKF